MSRDKLVHQYKCKISRSNGSLQDLYVAMLGKLCGNGSREELLEWAACRKAEFEMLARRCQDFTDLLERQPSED
jgi:hypothetical protein